MAYYVPQFGSCFGASCSDIFPGDDVGAGPALSPYPTMTSPDVNVDVSVNGGGGVMVAPGMMAPGFPREREGLPWWLWLAIGYLVAKAVKEA